MSEHAEERRAFADPGSGQGRAEAPATEHGAAERALARLPGAHKSQVGSGLAPRMGGIALGNGLVLVSERFWAAAVREPGGGIGVAAGRKPRLPGSGGSSEGPSGRQAGRRGSVSGVEGIPLLRGLSRLGETLLVLALVKLRLPRAQLPLDAMRVFKALVGSTAATSAVRRWAPKSALVQEAGATLAAFVPAVLSVKNARITAYHGAEHKVIGNLERGGPGGVARASKEHDRCGTNLVGPLLAATVASNLLASGRRGVRSPAASALAGAFSVGLALEALRWATRHGDSLAARLLLAPGRAMQKVLTTSEPSLEELAVAERALAELLRLEGASGRATQQGGPARGK